MIMQPAAAKITQTGALLLALLTVHQNFSHTVLAQTAFGLSAIPPRLELQVKPGQAVTGEIKVRNESKTDKVINIQAKDFIVSDDQGTPIQIETTADQNRWAASSWIQVSQTQLRLKPLETKALTVTVLAPDNATPGGHYAMILHSPDQSVALSQTGAAIQANVGTLVYITVPGDIKQDAQVDYFNAPSFSEFGPVDIRTTITNLSDIHIKPVGEIKITNWLGGTTANLPLEDTNIFPDASRHFLNTLNKKFLFGRYKAQLLAGYGTAGGALAATLYFWVIPWRLIILVIAFIALLAALVYLIRKTQTPPAATEAKIGELEKELEDLKNKYKDRK